MAKIIEDYSEYRQSEYERYKAIRSDQKTLKYNYYFNRVLYDRDEHILSIKTDHYKEFVSVYDLLEDKAKELSEKRGKTVLPDYLGQDEESEEFRQEDLRTNESVWENLNKKYQIDPGEIEYMQEMFYKEHPEIPQQPLINLLSGRIIDLRLGEGILDFVYADFESPLKKTLEGLSVFLYLQEIGENYRNKQGIQKQAPAVSKVLNKDQILTENYHAFLDSFQYVSQIAYAALYSAICPPLIKNSESQYFKETEAYGKYLMELQKEYRELLEFCYDEDYFPEVMGELTPSERYAVYRILHNYPSWTERTEMFSLSHLQMSGSQMPYGMEKKEEQDRFVRYIRRNKTEFEKFAKKHHISPVQAQIYMAKTYYITVSYQISSVADMLQLEFTKMLEENIRFRKCKRCGRYFIMKGNYNTNFCDRIDPETGKTCKELGAIDNFKKKIADNAAIPLYQKYYKRYAARVKVRQIKEADFKRWKNEAVFRRDECCEGRISLEEYEEWLEGSFANRKKIIRSVL